MRKASREKADLEKRLKKAEEIAKRTFDEAKEAKDEAKHLKKELDESMTSLKKSKEHSQKVENRFREASGWETWDENGLVVPRCCLSYTKSV